MCLICLELDKLSFVEGVSNLGEMTESIGEEHTVEVVDELLDLLNVKDYLTNKLDSLVRVINKLSKTNQLKCNKLITNKETDLLQKNWGYHVE